MHIDHIVSGLPAKQQQRARQRLAHVPEAMLAVVDEHIGAGLRCEGLIGPTPQARGLYTKDKLVKVGQASLLPPSHWGTLAGVAEFGARSALLTGVLAAAGAGTATALTYGLGGATLAWMVADAAPGKSLATHILGTPLADMLHTSESDVLVHECAHAADHALGEKEDRSLAKPEYGIYHNGEAIQSKFHSLQDPKLIELFEKCRANLPGHQFVSYYAGSHPVEYFAESMRVYLKNRSEMNRQDPAMTAYLDKIVHEDLPRAAGLPPDPIPPLPAGPAVEHPRQFYQLKPKAGFYVGERFERYYPDAEKLRAAETIPDKGLAAVEVRGAEPSPKKRWMANLLGFGAGLAAHAAVAAGLAGASGPAPTVLRALTLLTFPSVGMFAGEMCVRQSVDIGRIDPEGRFSSLQS